MGVYSLTWFFLSKKAASKGRGWVKKPIKGPLVVDGNQFLHQTSDRFKGTKSYADFYEYVAKIIRKLKQCGIEPYFIFDGVDKQDKFTSEYRKKAVSKNQVPTLLYTVYHHVLIDMEVHMYVADGEGDLACAEVANFFGCAVLSCDSDFFLFDIREGYVDLKSLLSEKFFENDSEVLKAEVFLRRDFVRSHYHRNPDSIFLFPAILGNGISPPTGSTIDSTTRWNAEKVDSRFCQSPTLQIDSLPNEVRKNFDQVRQYYNNSELLNPEQILASPIPNCPIDVPEWFRMCYRTRDIPIMVFDALVNHAQHHGSSAHSVRIRKCCYTVLGVREVKEYRSIRQSGNEERIRCFSDIPDCLILGEIERGKDEDKKRSMLYFALDCEQNAAQLDELNDADRLFMCTVIFWKSSVKVGPSVVKALLACFVKLSSTTDRREIVRISDRYRSPFVPEIHYQLIDWQCVYRDALALYLLLCHSPQTTHCPSIMIDENVVVFLASERNIDHAIFEFIRDEHLLGKYRNISRMLGM